MMATEKDTTVIADEREDANAELPKPAKVTLAHRLYTGQISYDFVAHRRRWYIISAIALVASLLAVLLNGLNMGIEFRGGVDFQAPVQVSAQTVPEVRDAVASLGLAGQDDITVTTMGDNKVRVQTKPLTPDEVVQVKKAISGAIGIQPDDVTYTQIGASWGQQITTKALIALAVFLTLVMLLIWIYFRDFKMSIAAIIALVHDLVITVGVYALIGFTVTPATMIGVLTILGYSLYDTVVVFDKIRENTKDILSSDRTYSQAANAAVNQVLVRSLNTTIIGVLPVAALLFTGWFVLGTGPLKDLGLALFVGMIAGAYSSIFIATPLLAQLRERDADMTEHREHLERKRARAEVRASAQSKTKAGSSGAAATKKVALELDATTGTDVATPGLVDAKTVEQAARQQRARQPRSKRKH